MPSFDSALYSAQVGSAGESPAFGRPGAKTAAGKMRLALIPYTVDGAEASADTINLCRLKWGAVPIPNMCKVSSEAAFDVDDMNVGTAANDNALADAIDTLNAASDVFFTGGDNHYAPAEISEDKDGADIIATLINVVTTTAGQLVLFCIVFVDE
jgi:hypothetical protein